MDFFLNLRNMSTWSGKLSNISEMTKVIEKTTAFLKVGKLRECHDMFFKNESLINKKLQIFIFNLFTVSLIFSIVFSLII